jgi:hypothetical protein
VKWPISQGRSFRKDLLLTIEAGGILGFYIASEKKGSVLAFVVGFFAFLKFPYLRTTIF